MKFSARIKEDAERYGVPAQTLIMADLMVLGYTDNEAYNIAYVENERFPKAQNVSIRESIIATKGFETMLNERKARVGAPMTDSNPEIKEQYSKEEIASKLRTQIERLPDGSKEKADVLMKYADLFAMKKEDTKPEEEDIIRVWMPLTCDICPYKKAYNENRPGK